MIKQKAVRILAAMLIISIVSLFLPQGILMVHAADEVCGIGPVRYESLADALADADDGDKILLLEDITYEDNIIIFGKNITFSLNDHVLNVVSTSGAALHVIDANVGIEGSGEFNVTGGHMGVYAEMADPGKSTSVTVTNASSTGVDGMGAYAVNASVTVQGDAASQGAGSIGVLLSRIPTLP